MRAVINILHLFCTSQNHPEWMAWNLWSTCMCFSSPILGRGLISKIVFLHLAKTLEASLSVWLFLRLKALVFLLNSPHSQSSVLGLIYSSNFLLLLTFFLRVFFKLLCFFLGNRGNHETKEKVSGLQGLLLMKKKKAASYLWQWRTLLLFPNPANIFK